jgi:hypothetical protein
MIAVTYLPLFVTLLLMFPDNRKPNVYRKMSAWKRFLIRQIPLLSVEGKRAFILAVSYRGEIPFTSPPNVSETNDIWKKDVS